MAPLDQTAGAVDSSTLLWGPLDWDFGANSVAPSGASISSYQVLDELISYYMNPLNFPNMKVRLQPIIYLSRLPKFMLDCCRCRPFNGGSDDAALCCPSQVRLV
jgi:hypothetical protein